MRGTSDPHLRPGHVAFERSCTQGTEEYLGRIARPRLEVGVAGRERAPGLVPRDLTHQARRALPRRPCRARRRSVGVPRPRRRRGRRVFPFKPQPVASPLHEWSPRDQTSCDVCGAAAAVAVAAVSAAAAENPEPRAWSSPAFPARSARPAQAASPHSGRGVLARPAQRGLGVPAPPRPGLGPPGPQCGG
ncbi:unnamed protein product [Rangifer tarandus platyrhynchus]|uniref:Uncharacterized protein n=1 Tax=Rangifer tarandus platyrhynchus TaxID=3082113 RepID=A0ABN8YQ14_RANTA|nr:unnamed protein product [Rangifer tarandus platyrhynchus]